MAEGSATKQNAVDQLILDATEAGTNVWRESGTLPDEIASHIQFEDVLITEISPEDFMSQYIAEVEKIQPDALSGRAMGTAVEKEKGKQEKIEEHKTSIIPKLDENEKLEDTEEVDDVIAWVQRFNLDFDDIDILEDPEEPEEYEGENPRDLHDAQEQLDCIALVEGLMGEYGIHERVQACKDYLIDWIHNHQK